MRLIKEEAIGTDDVTICTQFSDLSSRSEVNISTMNYATPFIASPMWHLGTPEMLMHFASGNSPYVLHRYFSTAELQYKHLMEATYSAKFNPEMMYNIFMAVGYDYDWINYLAEKGITNFCVDMANGNSSQCEKTVAYIKGRVPNARIMAGNVESIDGYIRLFEAGATYIRVGIASGSICSTNINTGNGLPILTALDNIYSKMSEYSRQNSWLIADGGMRTAGDVAKAIAFGATYAMCGKMFASTSHAQGPFYYQHPNELLKLMKEDGKFLAHGANPVTPSLVEYAGMASKMMREKAGGSQKTNVSEEGRAGLIKYTGKTEDVFNGLKLNLQAVMAYSGCRCINEFREEVILQRIAMGGKREKKIHLDKVY